MMLKLSYNPQITINQHFVPSHFLTAWCSDGMLWVSNKDFKLFQQKPHNVAKSKGIYSSEYMTADEFIANFSKVADLAKKINPELFRLIMDGMVSNLLYREICDGHLTRNDFNRIVSFIEERGLCSNTEVTLLRLIWAIYENGCVPEDIKHFCEKHFVEGIEPFVTRVEQIAYPLIEMLRCGESTFLADPEKRPREGRSPVCLLLAKGLCRSGRGQGPVHAVLRRKDRTTLVPALQRGLPRALPAQKSGLCFGSLPQLPLHR